MQRLTIMILGALAIGLSAFVCDQASAQTAANMAPVSLKSCPKYESTVYFAPDSTGLNAYSDYTIDRMAEDAKACGAKGVIVQAADAGERAATVATALRAHGLKAVIVPSPAIALSGETIVNRSVILRVAAPGLRQS